MPVIVWIIIAIIGAGATTAVVVPAVVGNDDPEVKTAPAEPGAKKTTPVIKTAITDPIGETAPIVPDTTILDDEPLPEKLPYADEPLLPLTKTGSKGMTSKLPF